MAGGPSQCPRKWMRSQACKVNLSGQSSITVHLLNQAISGVALESPLRQLLFTKVCGGQFHACMRLLPRMRSLHIAFKSARQSHLLQRQSRRRTQESFKLETAVRCGSSHMDRKPMRLGRRTVKSRSTGSHAAQRLWPSSRPRLQVGHHGLFPAVLPSTLPAHEIHATLTQSRHILLKLYSLTLASRTGVQGTERFRSTIISFP